MKLSLLVGCAFLAGRVASSDAPDPDEVDAASAPSVGDGKADSASAQLPPLRPSGAAVFVQHECNA